jgi:general secretion pathway protein D
VVVSSEDDATKIRKLVKLLDKEAPRGQGDIHVFYLQHANAEELTKVLTAIPSKKTAGKNKGKAPILSKDARIVADPATNSLVIMADQDDYLVLEEVIQKLDIPRMMVFIEALFMEVNVEKDFNLGVEWQGIKTFSYDGKNAGAFAGSSPSNFNTLGGIAKGALPQGFSMGIISEAIEIAGVKFPNLAAVVNAYQQDRDVHILSTPQILTTDNEEAEIMVGKNVPYQVRQETTEARLDYSSYEYKDVGVTLKITPQISQERFVRLKIYEEVTRLVDDTVLLTSGRPETWKRLAQTTVIVKDANTVVIGGLIGDETTTTDYKVPCLGDLPLLGWLFKGTSKDRQKTNLFIFLTPRIIQNPAEARKIYLDKKEQIERIKEGVIKMYDKPKPKPLTDETPKTGN